MEEEDDIKNCVEISNSNERGFIMAYCPWVALEELDLLVEFHIIASQCVHLSLQNCEGTSLLTTFLV